MCQLGPVRTRITRVVLEVVPGSLMPSTGRDFPDRTLWVRFTPPEVASAILVSLSETAGSLVLSRRPAPLSATAKVRRGCPEVAEDIASPLQDRNYKRNEEKTLIKTRKSGAEHGGDDGEE